MLWAEEGRKEEREGYGKRRKGVRSSRVEVGSRSAERGERRDTYKAPLILLISSILTDPSNFLEEAKVGGTNEISFESFVPTRLSSALEPAREIARGTHGDNICGFIDTLNFCSFARSSGISFPASSLTSVVFPVPFSPSMTMISESVNFPALTCSLNPPIVFVIDGYENLRDLGVETSSAVSEILNVSDSVRNRRFSVGIIPSRKILIPRTEE